MALPDAVELGEGSTRDPNVILGYPTGRPIPDRRLRIGRNARMRSGTVIYEGSTIGDELETGHSVIIREENRIGHRVRIWSNSVIDYGCIIGDGARIHNNVYIAQFTEIGEEVFIGPGVTTANDPHPVCTLCMKGPTIRAGARIGAGAVILPHVVVGEHALVGAGAVVTKDVPARAVVMGNPGAMVGDIRDLACRTGHKTKAYPDEKS